MWANHEKKQVFIRNMKTGSGAITMFLVEKGWTEIYGTHEYYKPEMTSLADYFKFCFIRNPYTQFASGYHEAVSCETIPKGTTFIDYLKNHTPQYLPQHLYAEGSDFIGRYEEFEKEWERLLKLLDIPFEALPKKRKRGCHFYGKYDYNTLLTEEGIEWINHNRKEDFKKLGYEMRTR